MQFGVDPDRIGSATSAIQMVIDGINGLDLDHTIANIQHCVVGSESAQESEEAQYLMSYDLFILMHGTLSIRDAYATAKKMYEEAEQRAALLATGT